MLGCDTSAMMWTQLCEEHAHFLSLALDKSGEVSKSHATSESAQKSKTSYSNLLKLALWQGNHYLTFNSQTKLQQTSHTFPVRSLPSG